MLVEPWRALRDRRSREGGMGDYPADRYKEKRK